VRTDRSRRALAGVVLVAALAAGFASTAAARTPSMTINATLQ
jgi:hypothetical protein